MLMSVQLYQGSIVHQERFERTVRHAFLPDSYAYRPAKYLQNVSYLIPDPVLEYIEQHGLFRDRPVEFGHAVSATSPGEAAQAV